MSMNLYLRLLPSPLFRAFLGWPQTRCLVTKIVTLQVFSQISGSANNPKQNLSCGIDLVDQRLHPCMIAEKNSTCADMAM
jgi:hypothetical protein